MIMELLKERLWTTFQQGRQEYAISIPLHTCIPHWTVLSRYGLVTHSFLYSCLFLNLLLFFTLALNSISSIVVVFDDGGNKSNDRGSSSQFHKITIWLQNADSSSWLIKFITCDSSLIPTLTWIAAVKNLLGSKPLWNWFELNNPDSFNYKPERNFNWARVSMLFRQQGPW